MSKRAATKRKASKSAPKNNNTIKPIGKKAKGEDKTSQLLSNFANSDAKHDFNKIYDYKKTELNKSLPESGTDRGEDVFEDITGVKLTNFVKELTNESTIFKVTNGNHVYTVQRSFDISPSGLTTLLNSNSNYCIVYDSSNINFKQLFCEGNRKETNNINLYFVKNREYVADSASKPNIKIEEAKKMSKEGFMIEDIEDIYDKSIIFIDYNNDEIIPKFYSNYSIELGSIIENNVAMTIIGNGKNTETFENTHEQLNVTGMSSYIEAAKTEFKVQCGFIGKRSGDWLQALSCTQEIINLHEFSESSDKTNIKKIQWILITHDRWLLSYALFLGINVLFSKAADSSSDKQIIYFQSNKYGSIDMATQLKEFALKKERMNMHTEAIVIENEFTKSKNEYLENTNKLLSSLKKTDTKKLAENTTKIIHNLLIFSNFMLILNDKIQSLKETADYFKDKNIESFFKDDSFQLENASKYRYYYVELSNFKKTYLGMKEGDNLIEKTKEYCNILLKDNNDIIKYINTFYELHSSDDVSDNIVPYLIQIYSNRNYYIEEYNMFLHKLEEIRERSLLRELKSYNIRGKKIIDQMERKKQADKKRLEKKKLERKLLKLSEKSQAKKKEIGKSIKKTKSMKTIKKKFISKKGGADINPATSILQSKINQMKEEEAAYASKINTTEPTEVSHSGTLKSKINTTEPTEVSHSGTSTSTTEPTEVSHSGTLKSKITTDNPTEVSHTKPIEIEFNIDEILTEIEKQNSDYKYYKMKNTVTINGHTRTGQFSLHLYKSAKAYFSEHKLLNMLNDKNLKRFLTILLNDWRKNANEWDEDALYYDELQDAINSDLLKIFKPTASNGLNANGISLLELSGIDFEPMRLMSRSKSRSSTRRRRTKSAPAEL